MITAHSAEWLRLYRFYQHHTLPFTGGLYDQPAKYLEAMEIIERQLSNG